MKAVRFSRYGGPEVLEVVDAAVPEPPDGAIRVKVHAAGVNGIDWKIRAGHMREMIDLPLPAGTGIDAAGVVDAIGGGVEGVTIGDAVFGSGSATLAEYAILEAWAHKPDDLSFEEAAGYPVPVETALRILEEVGARSGQTLVVSGASGGVGSAVVQVARERGIVVIGTAGEANQDYLRGLGAVATVYGDGLVERVRALAPGGVDAFLDVAGSGVIAEAIELTGDPSRVLSIADIGALEHGARFSGQAGDRPAALREAVRLHAEAGFRLRVEEAFPLADAAQAHARSATGHAAGRVVVSVVP